ncbi:hypothetical protein, partial [Bosea thiooxidans]
YRAGPAQRPYPPPRRRSCRSRSPPPSPGSGWSGASRAERFYGIIYWLLLLVGLKLAFDGVRGLAILGLFGCAIAPHRKKGWIT